MIKTHIEKKTGRLVATFSGKDLRDLETCAAAMGEPDIEKAMNRIVREDSEIACGVSK
ncbi:MAG: hypothetical protein M3R59_03210 [Verrucomicrobiota bacterium]|nr:hypothetical protein [Verrucomicrobiota bacterium]